MGNTEALELGRIRVDIPVPYTTIKELHITDHANEYGTMHLCLILPEAEENIAERMEGQSVTVLTPQEEVVFAGLCTGVGLARENGYVEMHLEARSHAYVMDRIPRSQTFQSPQKTLKEVAGIVLEGYAVSLELERDIPIKQMLSQQEETDWQFLRRIANQFEMLVFTDVKSAGIRIHIGVVPFSSRSLTLGDGYSAKDISMYWDVKQNTRKDASAYEFLQRGGTLADLTVGSGCAMEGKDAPQIVTGSEINSHRGLLRNEILLSYVDGAVPAPGEVFQGTHRGTGIVSDASAVSFTSVLTGEVSQVYGTDIEVDFGRGPEDTRRIPYTNLLGNDVYAMPDEKDKVFCYYDNGGEVVALGSKVEDTSSPDYDKPYEKSLTANNRMIRFREEGIDLTGSRSEYDGGEGRQVKITFSDTEGIDIAAEGDISITAAGNITLLARELPGEEEDPTAWFDDSFEANMKEFTARHEAGDKLYLAHNGKVSEPALLAYLLEMRRMINESTEEGLKRAVKSIIRFITENEAFTGQESQEEPPALVFDSVEDRRISMVALGELQVVVGGSSIRLIGNHIYLSTAYFEQLGLQTRGGYPEVSESPRSGMDIFLDFVNVALDVVVLFFPALAPLKVITAGIYFFRGDYASAALSLIPFGKIGNLFEKAPKVAKVICYVKAGVDIANAEVSLKNAKSRLGELYSRQGLSMFGDQETWESILAVTQSTVDLCQTAKYMSELGNGGNSRKPPEGDDTKGSGSVDTDEPKPVAGRPDGNDTKPVNNKYGLDPVNVVTGSQKITQTEFVIRDISGDFLIQRHYESIYKNSSSMLGERWFLNVGSYLSIQGDSAVIILPDRHLERFRRGEKGGWENLRGGDGSVTLTEKDRQYLLHQKKEEKLYRYDFAGKLTAIEDRNGNTIFLKYMGAVLVEMNFPCGQVLTFQYERGKLKSITDAIGRTVQYAYEGELLTRATYPNGGTISYQYTEEGFLTGITDQNGNLYVQNEYAGDGRVTRQFLNQDTEHVILYDDHNRINTFLNMSNGGRVEYHYNTDSLIVETVYADGSTEEIRYDDRENKIWEKDRRGNERNRVFDRESRLLEETLPNGLCTRYVYNDEGLPAHVWDNAGRQQWYQYDRHGNLTEIRQEIITGVVRRVRFTYDSLGRVTEILDANGNRTAYTYEGALGLPSAITTPEGHTVRYAYDRAGRCMEVTDVG